MRDKAIYIILIFIIIYILLTGACSATYDNVNNEKSYIEESDGELPEDTVQGNSYTIATNERIEESNGDIDENPIVGTDINIIKNDSVKEDEQKEENTPIKENTPEETTDIKNESIQEETPEETESDPILVEDEKPDELADKDLSEDSFIDDIKHEDHKSTNEEENKIDSELHNKNPDKTEPIPIKSSLGQIFTLSSKDNKITYLFLQLIPRTGMSTVEIGKDALGMLLNSINLIENAPKRIGKVDYVVVGVEMNPNDVWYFIASVGDLKGYLNGMLDRDQLLDRIEIKKGMPNVFDS